MKKFQMAFMITFALFLLSTMSSFAQYPNQWCDPCPEDTNKITPEFPVRIWPMGERSVDPNHRFEYHIDYEIKLCDSSGIPSISLTKIEGKKDGQYQNFDIDIAIGQILDRWGPMEIEGQQYNQLRFRVPACWTFTNNEYNMPDLPDMPEYSYIPCPNVHCCEVIITYSYFSQEFGTDPSTGLNFYTGHINNLDHVYDWECMTESPTPCFHVCNELYLGYYNYIPSFPVDDCNPCPYPYVFQPAINSMFLIDENDPRSLIKFTYFYRYCNHDDTKEIFINYIATPYTTAYSSDEMYKYVIKRLLAVSYSLFNSMDNVVRLTTTPCWTRYEYGQTATLNMCGGECCYTIYDVKRIPNSLTFYVNEWQMYSDHGCNPCSNSGNECNICFCDNFEVFNIESSEILSNKRAIEDELLANQALCTITPNPTKDKIEIKVNEESIGMISIHIFDILGNQVFEIEETKNKDIHTFNIPTLEFTAGIYNFVITIDNKPIYNGKFIKL